MIRGTFQETLKCALTPDEVKHRAAALAIVQGEIEEVQDAAKSTADAFKQERKILESKRAVLAREVRDESTFRPVDCVERMTSDNMIETVRTDTGEIRNTRPANEKEKQRNFLDDPPPSEPE